MLTAVVRRNSVRFASSQLGGLVGLVPAPYQSGDTVHDQGITRAGFGSGGKRLRRIEIVALARKLLIALWRYLQTGTIPEGAHLKPVEV